MPQQSSIFFSQDGLRSGWGALLFILLLSIVIFCRGIFLQGKQLAASDHAVSNFAFLTPQIIIILCCTAIAAAILCVTLLGGGGNFGVAKVSATCVLLLVWLSILVIAVVSSAHTRQAAEQVAEAKRNASIAATAGFPALSRLGPEVSQFAVVLIATWILSRVEHRPFGAYGLGGGHWRQFGHGLSVGLTALSMLVGLLWWGRWMTFERLSSDSAWTTLADSLLWALFFTLVALGEEFLFRGYLQFTLARAFGRNAVGFFFAASLLSIFFTLAHANNRGESPIGLVHVGLFGMVACLSLWRSGNLWWIIGVHTSWDWCESFLFGTANSGYHSRSRFLTAFPHGLALSSGGDTGPEGSILGLVTL